MTPVELLRSARDRLSDPARWLHDPCDCAVDVHGRGVVPWDPLAARWDLLGALSAVNGRWFGINDTVRFVLPASGHADVFSFATWHDAPERTHAEVLAVLDRAIRLAEGGA